MQLRLLSDLHFEVHADNGRSFVESLDSSGCDALVLAGDICTVGEGLLNALDLFCKKFPLVLFVKGNHEFYRSDRGKVHATLQKAKNRNSNLHVLDRDVVILDGRRFLGATLWYPQTRLATLQAATWSDFLSIQGFAKWVYEENAKDVLFLRRELQEGDIVITHYLPSYRSVHPRYATAATNCFFVCDLEELIVERKPRLMLHGHTHDSQHFQVGATETVCNPFGYIGADLNPRFDENLTIEV